MKQLHIVCSLLFGIFLTSCSNNNNWIEGRWVTNIEEAFNGSGLKLYLEFKEGTMTRYQLYPQKFTAKWHYELTDSIIERFEYTDKVNHKILLREEKIAFQKYSDSLMILQYRKIKIDPKTKKVFLWHNPKLQYFKRIQDDSLWPIKE